MRKTFGQIADMIASSLSETMQTTVFIRDDKHKVIASKSFGKFSSTDHQNGTGSSLRSSAEYLTLPLHVLDEVGEVQIQKFVDNDTISPKLAQAFLDLVVSKIAYPAFPDQQTFKNQIISNLLRNEFAEASLAKQQASLLSIDFNPPRAVILIDMAEFFLIKRKGLDLPSYQRQHLSRLIINSIVNFFSLPDDTICADLGGGEFAVLKASDTKNLDPWATHDVDLFEPTSSTWMNLEALKRASEALLAKLKEETSTALSIGIGRYYPGISGLACSYQDAKVALRLGRQIKGPDRVHCLDDLGIAAFAFVADERTKLELALHLLSPLENDHELLHTLKVFFTQNCALSLTAKQLCIHRNTLTYRLQKIASLTGLDPRRFDEAVQIRLALLLRDIKTIEKRI